MADINVSDPAIAAAYLDVRNDNTETNWLRLGHKDDKNLQLEGSGSGGIEEFKSGLREDGVQYGYLRVITGDSESKRAKFVLVSWAGQKVGALKRARVSVHKAKVKTVLKEFSVEKHGENLEELDETSIQNAVKKASGADYSGNPLTK
jgi:hypothetical protein